MQRREECCAGFAEERTHRSPDSDPGGKPLPGSRRASAPWRPRRSRWSPLAGGRATLFAVAGEGREVVTLSGGRAAPFAVAGEGREGERREAAAGSDLH
jgi:hypothetical protein